MKIKDIGYDFASSNVRMFKMKRFGAGNKQDITNMNQNPILGQGRRRRVIIYHVLLFLTVMSVPCSKFYGSVPLL